jgi:hypothetical protein
VQKQLCCEKIINYLILYSCGTIRCFGKEKNLDATEKEKNIASKSPKKVQMTSNQFFPALQGYTFVVIGSYPGLTNQRIQQGIKNYGGQVLPAPYIERADYLVVNPQTATGESLTEQRAEQAGIPVITLPDIFSEIQKGRSTQGNRSQGNQYYPQNYNQQQQYYPQKLQQQQAASFAAPANYQATAPPPQRQLRGRRRFQAVTGSCTIQQAQDFLKVADNLAALNAGLSRQSEQEAARALATLKRNLHPLEQRLQEYIESGQCPEEQQLARQILSTADEFFSREAIAEDLVQVQVEVLSLLRDIMEWAANNYTIDPEQAAEYISEIDNQLQSLQSPAAAGSFGGSINNSNSFIPPPPPPTASMLSRSSLASSSYSSVPDLATLFAQEEEENTQMPPIAPQLGQEEEQEQQAAQPGRFEWLRNWWQGQAQAQAAQ